MSDLALGVLEDHPLYKKLKLLHNNQEILTEENVVFIDIGNRSLSDEGILTAAYEHFFGRSDSVEIEGQPSRGGLSRSTYTESSRLYLFAHPVFTGDAYVGYWDEMADYIHKTGDPVLSLGPLDDDNKKKMKQNAIMASDTGARFHRNDSSWKLFKLEPDPKKVRVDERKKYLESFPKKTGMVRNGTLEDWINACTQRYDNLFLAIRHKIPDSVGRRVGGGSRMGMLHLRSSINRRMALIRIVRELVIQLSNGVRAYGQNDLSGKTHDPKCYRVASPVNAYSRSTPYEELLEEMKAALPKMKEWVDGPEGIDHPDQAEERRAIKAWFHEFCKQEVADSEKGAVTNVTPETCSPG